MNTWSMSDWLMVRSVLGWVFVSMVIIGAWVAVAIRRRWSAWRAQHGAVAVAEPLPPMLTAPQAPRPGMVLSGEAANDSRPRAA